MNLNQGFYIIPPVRVSPQASPCGICDEVALGQLFQAFLPCQYCFINARYPYYYSSVADSVSLQELAVSLHKKILPPSFLMIGDK